MRSVSILDRFFGAPWLNLNSDAVAYCCEAISDLTGQIIYSSPQQVFDSEVYNGQFLFMVDNWTKELRAQRNNGASSEIFY